jgi:hypothetical protein
MSSGVHDWGSLPTGNRTYSAATTRAKIDREAETFDDVMADRFA